MTPPLWNISVVSCQTILLSTGCIVEVDGGDITRDLSVARSFAKQARLQKIAISIDRLGGEGAALRRIPGTFPSSK